ncbi:MAG: hypothetical protein OER90_18125, partial [Gemmatimonadota bacterium]|nr:hypothetical protein [Gemmatimonadota bacterium]
MKAKLLALLSTAVLVVACGDGTGPGGPTQVSLSFSTAASGPMLSVMAADTMTDGQNQLVLSSVEVVLREIELERIDIADCDVEPEPAGCEKFETAPMVVELPLGGTTQTGITIDIAAGTYDELEFDIHKVSNGDPEDAAFRAAHPDLIDTSIRVRGEYNGVAFTYVT